MQLLHFSKEALPDSVSTDIQNLNKLSEEQYVSLTDILFCFLTEPKETDRFLSQLNEFASENGMSPGPLKNLVKSVLLVPNGALKRNLTAEQVKADLITLGLNEDKASHFADQWKVRYPALSRLAVEQTLMVNQLVDMEWKFGVTAGSSELHKVGSIFLQLKLVVRKGNATENIFMATDTQSNSSIKSLKLQWNTHKKGRLKITLDLIRRSPVSEGDMFREFQEWCLRTYGDSGKTKTVTRRKYNKILQTLLQGEESGDSGFIENNHVNAKFKFWVKSKGFQVGSSAAASSHSEQKKGASGKPMLYVPVKSTISECGPAQDSTSLKRVAVVEDFFDIIYSMHVEMGSDPGKAPKHAGQKKTYKAIAETYAFLPREAVTRFLMSCHECQKRMHINPSGAESKENDRPVSLVPGLIDYNMPITTTYLKQMKLCSMGANEQDESSVSSEDFDMTDPTWMSADHGTTTDLSPSQGERMHTPPNRHKEEDVESEAVREWLVGECHGPTITSPGISDPPL
ncbi:UNVERIFIED_CONTAM: hypothetical protein FKN15_075094 [Acipenser sinensis]